MVELNGGRSIWICFFPFLFFAFEIARQCTSSAINIMNN